jgi:hypothetical protein
MAFSMVSINFAYPSPEPGLTIGHRMSASGNRTYDAIVVGAGHNGLTAACYLARAGLSTLVLERRDIVGGCCVTEEIAPGCRASTTSYIASMLRPEVIRDLKLGEHGLRMVPCDPALQVPFPEGQLVSWWANRDRVVAELRKISLKDAETFVRVDDQLKKLALYLQPFFLEPPPEIDTKSLGGWSDLLRVGKRFRGISSAEISQFVSFLTGSLGISRSQLRLGKVKTLFLANNVYGKHGGPYPARIGSGSAVSLAQRRRRRTTGILRARDGRDGRDHGSDGGGRPGVRSGDTHRRSGRADRFASWSRARSGSGRWNRGPRSHCALERRPEADVS